MDKRVSSRESKKAEESISSFKQQKGAKTKRAKEDPIQSLLLDIEKLKDGIEVKKTKKSEKHASQIFRIGSTDSNTGLRHVHSPKTAVQCSKKNKRTPAKDTQSLVKDFANSDSSASASFPEADHEIDSDCISSDNGLLEILQSCDALIKECQVDIRKQQRQTWFERRDAALTKWESCRPQLLEAAIVAQALKDVTCFNCNDRPAILICKQCRKYKYLCFVCDDIVHSKDPLHDRQIFCNNYLQKITPVQGLAEDGSLVKITRCPVLTFPRVCSACNGLENWIQIPNEQCCILVNNLGRFDLYKFKIECGHCGVCFDMFNDVTGLIASRYWPGTVGSITYLFDEDLFQTWDSYMLRMPGSSEHGFLGSLEDISLDNNRVGRIQRDAFAQAFKEYKFLTYELNRIRGYNPFECPPCSIIQHAAIFDGNLKMYRYKSAGKRMRGSYYQSLFVCDNKNVESVVNEIYNKPTSSRQETDPSLCGTTQWLAARNVSQDGRTRDETGIELVSCRHCIALKAVNMFRGEIFGYAYYLQKNITPNATFYFSDVACRYSKWLRKNDFDLYMSQTPAIGMMHVKGHPAFCEVLYGGIWKTGSGYTIGEEDEQIFSYLSRTGPTIKHMLPENRDDSITEFAMFWNKRKIDNMAESLHRRFKQVCKKEKETEQKIRTITSEPIKQQVAVWKSDATVLAQACQNTLVDAELSPAEELVLLYTELICQGKLPSDHGLVMPMKYIKSLQFKNLKLRILAKPSSKLEARYKVLNESFKNERRRFSGSEIMNIVCGIIPLYQQKLEGLVYSNLHISHNISRLADSSKKRRQLRLKVANQKILIKDTVDEYNANILAANLQTKHPTCSVLAVERQEFPWQKKTHNNSAFDPETKQELITASLLLERLQEEKVLLRTEMKNYIYYYKDKVIPSLKRESSQLLASSSQACKCQESTLLEGKKCSDCFNCEVRRGRLSLLLQGSSYAIEQIDKAQVWLRSILSEADDINLDEFEETDIQVSDGLTDGYDSSDESAASDMEIEINCNDESTIFL